MRATVLALALALVGICSAQHPGILGSSFAVGPQPHILAPDIAAGKTFLYKYDALLLGGLPVEGLAKAGLKVSSKVLISAAGQNMYMLQLVEPELYEFSGVWLKDPLVPATKLTSALAAQFMTPIKFEYANGVVGKMFAPEGISTLVLNVYRGILNIFQLNIKKTQNVYDLQEAGAQGICKTIYAIAEDEKAERILLTKTRDLNHCQEKIMKNIGVAYTETCPKCQQFSKTLRGATAYNYVLKPVDNSVLILEATVNELIQFSPFNEMNGAAQMETKQSLVFLETRAASIVPVAAEYLHRGSLKYEFSTELLQTPIKLMKIDNAHAQIVETLNHLVNYNMEKVYENAPLKFLELVQLLRTAHFEDLEMLWSRYKNKPVYRQWLLDAFPVIGTHVALRFIKDKFLADEMTVAEGVQALIASVHMVTANKEAINLFRALAVHSKILENAVLREVVLLGYGTMIYKYCAEEAVCPAELIKPVQELLAEAVANDKIQDIILLLKALGNAGHLSSLKSITKLLPIHGTTGASLPTKVHVDAILALRNLAKKEPKMVQELALQLFMDKSLNSELRMIACIVLFETSPPIGLVTTLANIVKKEENLQVASFAYSHMKSLTRSIHASVAAACNVAVKILSPRLNRLNLRFSKAAYLDGFNSPLTLGAAASAYYINDAATILPKSIVTKIRAFVSGAASDVVEVGVRTEGLQEALLKNPTVTDSADRITKMKRVIKALSEWRALPNSKPLASIYVKLFGQEIAFANIDQAWFDQAVAFAAEPSVRTFGRNALKALWSGASFHFAKPLLAAEIRRIMPTAAGLPMELSLYTAAVAAADVQVKATTVPALPENFHLAHLLKTNMKLETELRPQVAVNTYAVVGVNTALFQAGVISRARLNSALPAKIAARLDISEGNFKIEALPAGAPEEIVALHVETLAVARNVEDLPAERVSPIIPAKILQAGSRERFTSSAASRATDSMPSSYELIYREKGAGIRKSKAARFAKKYTVKADVVGLKSSFKISTENAGFLTYGTLYKLAGKHSAVLSLKAMDDAIEKVELEIQVGPKAAEKLLKQIQLSDEELTQGSSILKKLEKILVPSLKSNSSSSSSSSRSSSSRSSSSRSSSSRSSSSRTSSKSSSASSSSSAHVRNTAFKTASQKGTSIHNSSSRTSSSSSSSSSRHRSSSSHNSSSRTSSSSSSSSSSRRRSSSRNKRPGNTRFINSSSKTSSASSLASLFSASSSSSHSGPHRSKQVDYEKFQTNHKKQAFTSQAAAASVSKRSTTSSFENIYRQNKFLGDKAAPTVAIIFRAVRTDNKLQGYQLAVYMDQPNNRIQVILAALAADNNWKVCADGVLTSKHKVTAKIAWGAECKDHAMLTAETGLVGPRPAARFRIKWSKIIPVVKHLGKDLGHIIQGIHGIIHGGASHHNHKGKSRQYSFTAVATSDRTLDLICKTPKHTLYKSGLRLPIALPLDEIRDFNRPDDFNSKIFHLFSKAGAAECSFDRDTLTTFNNRRYKNESPLSCYQVLAKDCTNEMKFMVLLKKDHAEQNHINVKVADIDIDLYSKNNEVVLSVNGMEIPINNLPYQHPTAQIQIRQKEDGISVYAASYGLHEVYFNKNSWKVKVVDWMKGQTCGLCGSADGEVRREFRSPNRRVTKNPVSFAHSWVLPVETCRDTSECRMKLESVQLEKQVNSQVYRCFSVEPVLRCLPGCFPVKTTAVTVGFHCPQSGMNHPESLSSAYDNTVDLKDTTEAHLACRCTNQCA